jgi:YHS domain-containing protein
MPKSKIRSRFLAMSLIVVAGVLGTPSAASAYEEGSTSAVNVDQNGLALRGYDPVAYFTAGAATLGTAQFTATHDGANYQFVSAANRDLFLKEPTKYAPAFGGFCAMGAVMEKKLDGDPKLWKIVDGKLYLNVGEPAQKRWLEDVPGNISKASQNWPKIRNLAPKAL